MRIFRLFIIILCLTTFSVCEPVLAYSASTSAFQTKQKKKQKKKKGSVKKTNAPKEANPKPAPQKKERNYVVRGKEVLKLKAKKDANNLYGYENAGPKYYWWAEAHYMGNGKKQLNLGFEYQWVIAPMYTKVAKEFSEDLAAVELNGRVGFIDRQNRFIIPPAFEPMDDLDGFRYGLAAVKKEGKYGFINKKGEFVIEPIYDEAENFGDDYLAVVKLNDKFGCIDLAGEQVVPCNYKLKEVMKTLPGKNKPYRNAKKQARERWDAHYYDDFLVGVREAANVVDKKIFDPDYIEPVGSFVPDKGVSVGDGIFLITLDSGQMGAVDSYGRTLIAPHKKSVKYDYTQRLFIVEDSFTTPEIVGYEGAGIANTSGGWIIPPVFDSIGSFNDAGEATATVGTLTGTVDVFGMVDETFLLQLLEASVKEKGTEYTRHLVGILPTCAAAHNCLGVYYAAERDNLKDAIHHFTVAHNLDPKNKDFEENMKAAKSTRNNRRWNRVINGMTIAAAVISLGAVTYSTVKGEPMDASGFNSTSDYDESGSNLYTSYGSYNSDLSSSSGESTGANARNAKKMYEHWEKRAKEAYESLTKVSLSVSNYNKRKKMLRNAQKEMRKWRSKARKEGLEIPESEYESISVGVK